MKKNKIALTSRSLKLVFASAVSLSTIGVSQNTHAQDYFYIVHKPTGLKFYSCSAVNGDAVVATTEESACSQWEQVMNGSYFYLKNRESGKYIRPASSSNGAAIEVQPNTWTGNWTQWQYEDRGAGFGHLSNRATGKYVFIPSADNGVQLEQQPSSWRGDYTQWAFEPVTVSTPTPEPTATPTPTNEPTAAPTATPTPTAEPTATPTPTSEPTPVPTDVPQPNSEKIEAESGAVYGTAATFNDGAASGGLGVAYISEIGSGFSLTNVPASNEIVVTYASENSGQISLLVNGNDAGDLSFDSTGNWVGNYGTAQLNIDIPENATFDIVFESGDAALNVDFIEFNYSVVGPTPTPEPTATPCVNCPTPTPTPTDNPNCTPIDPAADLGDGYVYGMTTGGLVYHRAFEDHNPDFAIIGVQGAGTELPQSGPYDFTDSNGNTYPRYEGQVENVVAGQDYTLEVRIHGITSSGQCIHSITVKPGEGVTESPCFDDPNANVPPPPPKPVADVTDLDISGLRARAVGGSGSGFPGHALYTTTSSCDSENCLTNWPPLYVEDPEKLIGAAALTGTWSTRERQVSEVSECGDTVLVTKYQVTYNGDDVYFFAGDTSPDTVAGAGISGWDALEGDLIEQLPLIKKPMPGLQSTITGLTPGSHGYVIDLDGSSVTVRTGIGFQLLVHDTRYVDGVGSILTAIGNREFEFWCSNNQIQWHKADLTPIAYGQHETIVPGACYGDYFYYLRFAKRGPINDDPGSRWTYSGLFTTAGERIDPAQRETKVTTSANWMRFRHPHTHDGRTEFIGDAISNNSQLGGLLRFTMSTTDNGEGFEIDPGMNPIRIEALENGHLPNFVPVYNYNQPTCCGTAFDYGNVVTFEVTATVGGISSQTYTTHLNAVVGDGFNSPIGDPRMTLAGKAATNMVYSDEGPGEDSEKDAVFTQHITTLTTSSQVSTFLSGFAALHQRSIGDDRCGRCHFMDGRSDVIVNTDNGPRIPPPLYGVGLLEWVEGAEAVLTWDGDVNTVEDQVHNALRNDHKVDPDTVGNLSTLVDYTRFVTVPNRRHGATDLPGVTEGQELFHDVGCASCHEENQVTRSDAPPEFANIHISPFSDMKTHDIGTGGQFRTAPLWGIGTNKWLLDRNGMNMLFLHDGRAANVSDAINAHAGEASSVMNNYNALSTEEKQNIVRFIETL